jgi:hypothetical protein
LVKGLVVADKRTRVKNFHEQTLKGVAEIVGAMGLHSHTELLPLHIRRRIGPFDVRSYGDLVEWVPEGAWLSRPPLKWASCWDRIQAASF